VFKQRDIMQSDASFDVYTPSLSCLHTLEHFGLGRYGDTIDYEGYRRGWRNLVRMVQPGGMFFFSVPIGRIQRIEFDAHRIFSVPFLLSELIDMDFVIDGFAYVDDLGDIHHEVDPRSGEAKRTFDLNHGCGIFELRRRDL
jgi:hypothetical protein